MGSMKLTRLGNKVKIEITLDSEGRVTEKGNTLLYTSGGFKWFEAEKIGVNLNILKSKRAP